MVLYLLWYIYTKNLHRGSEPPGSGHGVTGAAGKTQAGCCCGDETEPRYLGERLSSLEPCGVGKVDAHVLWYKLARVYPTDLFIFPQPRAL